MVSLAQGPPVIRVVALCWEYAIDQSASLISNLLPDVASQHGALHFITSSCVGVLNPEEHFMLTFEQHECLCLPVGLCLLPRGSAASEQLERLRVAGWGRGQPYFFSVQVNHLTASC